MPWFIYANILSTLLSSVKIWTLSHSKQLPRPQVPTHTLPHILILQLKWIFLSWGSIVFSWKYSWWSYTGIQGSILQNFSQLFQFCLPSSPSKTSVTKEINCSITCPHFLVMMPETGFSMPGRIWTKNWFVHPMKIRMVFIGLRMW